MNLMGSIRKEKSKIIQLGCEILKKNKKKNKKGSPKNYKLMSLFLSFLLLTRGSSKVTEHKDRHTDVFS